MASDELKNKKKRGLSLFRIAGIQITLDYSWFIIFLLVIWSLSAGYFPAHYPDQRTSAYWVAGLAATLLFFASILAHELSHSLVARRSGIQVSEITLFIFGGLASITEESKDPKTEFKIAAVGPLTSFILAAFFWAAKNLLEGDVPSLPVVILDYLAWINLALGTFNLFPGFPLDGGRVFRAIWWWKTGSLTRATRVASDIGKGFAVTLMVLGGLQIFSGALVGGLWFIFIGMFLRGLAEGGYQELVTMESLKRVRAKETMVSDVIKVSPGLSLEQVISDYFLRYGYRGFPVTQNGKVLGVVALSNVKEVPEEERRSKTVEEVMIPMSDRIQISAEASLAEALRKMTEKDVGRLIVVENGKMVGMITKTGLLRFLEIKRSLED